MRFKEPPLHTRRRIGVGIHAAAHGEPKRPRRVAAEVQVPNTMVSRRGGGAKGLEGLPRGGSWRFHPAHSAWTGISVTVPSAGRRHGRPARSHSVRGKGNGILAGVRIAAQPHAGACNVLAAAGSNEAARRLDAGRAVPAVLARDSAPRLIATKTPSAANQRARHGPAWPQRADPAVRRCQVFSRDSLLFLFVEW